MSDGRKTNYHRLALLLASSNVAITALVMLSPFGTGDGDGVIGHSVVRLLVMVLLQAPITLGGVAASLFSLRANLPWLPGLLGNLVIIPATLFLYFT